MKMTQKLIAVAGLIGVACLAVAAPPDGPVVSRVVVGDEAAAPSPRDCGTSYVLQGESSYSQGCMGSLGGKLGYGCMCPMALAEEFTGSFTLTFNWHTPPGHWGYDVTVEDWLAILSGDEIEVTGDGYLDRWSDTEGNHWQAMTLDVYINGEEVQLFSGLVEDPAPGDLIPENISIFLSSEPACFGYGVFIDAALPPPPGVLLLGDDKQMTTGR